MAYNKIIYGGKVLIDLSADTITAADLKKGKTAHDMSGKSITGACDFDVNSSDGTVTSAEILLGKTAYARGVKITGTMPNNGAVSGVITAKNTSYSIPLGFHDGSGTVTIADKDKLIPDNIREGVTILGVVGAMSGSEDETPQDSKVVTPSSVLQTIVPDEGYTCMRQVTVNPIPYEETENSAGGITVTIG